jgi:FdhE protein
MPSVRDSWDDRIHRADALSAEAGPAQPILAFYAYLLRIQKDIYDSFRSRRLTGELSADASPEMLLAPSVLNLAVRRGPAALRERAEQLLSRSSTFDEIALPFWREPRADDFFGKALVQPYLQRLVDNGVRPRHRDHLRGERRCPICGGAPQLSILEEHAASLESGGRQLQCANCLNRWTFRRVMCVHCGEEDEHKLGYYRSEEFPQLRIDSCDTCRHYLKSIDLGRLGLAVPLVDEVAGVALDVSVTERGYKKIELNLIGM